MIADELLVCFLMYLKIKVYMKKLKTSKNKSWLFIAIENYTPLLEWDVYVENYDPPHLHIQSWCLVSEFWYQNKIK